MEGLAGGNGHAHHPAADLEPAGPLANEFGDDRDDLRPGDRAVLIVENDVGFARFLLDLARERWFKGLVTTHGAVALALAREHPVAAVSLDLHLPDIDGWRVLDRLKTDPATRHLPVCVVSTDESRDQALDAGALAFVAKPVPSRDILDRLFDRLAEYLAWRERLAADLDGAGVEVAGTPSASSKSIRPWTSC